ncbi:MSC_0621 family F1-like ATPase epsilon subunit [Mesomycoplasma conjunctivae]|uniref:MSC_0621 family F1-like ATPase epsilon subunit n=1 Tax=Mesomycoplasma conjunctivae TaxID=45361 RepID=UPI003DA56566
MVKNTSWNVKIITIENKVIELKNQQAFFNVDQEKQFIEVKPYSISNQKFSLIKFKNTLGDLYFFAHQALIYSLEDSLIIKLFYPLQFYRSNKKIYLSQRKKQEKLKNNFFENLKKSTLLDVQMSLQNYKEIMRHKLKFNENKLKELFFLVETEVAYE